MNILDWPSIKQNLVSDIIFLALTVITVPVVTLWIIKWRNRKSLVIKFSHILLELCDFLSYTEYRHNDLTSEHIHIFTKKSRIKEYKFVAISLINVFSPLVYPRIVLVVLQLHKEKTVDESYRMLKSEIARMSELRLEIDRLLSAHALHLDEEILLGITELCLMIRKLELTHKNNESFQELSNKAGSPMTGVFGLTEVTDIYTTIFRLIKQILGRGYFDFSIAKEKQD